MGYIEKTYGRSESSLHSRSDDTLVPTREYKKRVRGGQVRKEMCGAGALVLLHGLAVADGSCEWVEISAC